MGTETRGHSVADRVNGCERMRNLLESRCGAPAPETNKTGPRVHQREILPPRPCLLGCGRVHSHDRPPPLVDAQPRRRRPRAALADHGTKFILDTSAATAAAAVNSEIQSALRYRTVPSRRTRFRIHGRPPAVFKFRELVLAIWVHATAPYHARLGFAAIAR